MNREGGYEEEIPITPEIYHMLLHSTQLKTLLGTQGVSFTADNKSVILHSENEGFIKLAKREYFNPDINTFTSIKVDDGEMAALFNGNPEDDFSNFNVELSVILTRLSKSKMYEFIPRSKIMNDSFGGQNVLIVFVEKSRETELRNKIEEFIRSKTIEFTVRVGQISEEKKSVVRRYLGIGSKLTRSEETMNFVNLINAIQSRVSPFTGESGDTFTYEIGNIPYIFVCASSGTGKTQLPFSMNIPMLYLINNKNLVRKESMENTQPIYRNFVDVSRCFFECVERDIEILGFDRDNINDKIGTTRPDANNENAEKTISSEKLFVPSFIYMMFKRTKEARRGNGHWMEAQLSIEDGVKFVKMEIQEARAGIDSLFSGATRPVIFLDESQVSGSENFRVEYMYVRKVIRMLNLIPIFMGTNASLANFVSIETASTATREGGANTIWCYIVHRLASTSVEYIRSEKQLLVANARSEKYGLFVEKLGRLMERERPWFCNLAFEYLKSIGGDRFEVFEALESIVWYIMNEFQTRKLKISRFDGGKKDQYNFNNITLMLPEYWRMVIDSWGSTWRSDQLEKEKSNAIHNHIGYLYVSEQASRACGNRNYIPIILRDDETKIFFPNNRIVVEKFVPYHVFAPFSHETLGEMVFTSRRNMALMRILPNRKEKCVDRNSVMSALIEITSKYKILVDLSLQSAIKWTTLEKIASLSSLISSQCSGFGGSEFGDWLKCFVKNMSRSSSEVASFENVDVSINHDAGQLMKIRIPFCSSSLGGEWDREFADYMVSNGADLGIVHGELGNRESRDFYVERIRGEAREVVISGECKNHADGIGSADVNEIIEKLKTFGSRINFIISSKLNRNISEKISRDQMITVYELKKEKVGQNIKCDLVTVHRGRTESSVFIMMEVEPLDPDK